MTDTAIDLDHVATVYKDPDYSDHRRTVDALIAEVRTFAGTAATLRAALNVALNSDDAEALAGARAALDVLDASDLAATADARYATLRARLAAVEALAAERDVLYPERFGRTPTENYVMGAKAERARLAAVLRGA